ncbi:FAD-dependent pyridine nucleotide-disulfide oxidoreductase [Penicillium robsamsonii]|uniref:FAD-dependent pyridine nucleotide-disulfide oxidoreductase n=1 Tax=Penicillium robsamsonii TaxID=1792511 RepID=UPI002546A7BB|nr:FAD-dependent pyridine nucleotide-disulfide oxidoreductase [Penicillium robsamsonii]KAJ5834064.1 FAD-dependent pyridine nucleotide-disulfide oxidoreductase [Penicillium robsamsonii]
MQTRPLSAMLPLRHQALRIRKLFPCLAQTPNSTYLSSSSIALAVIVSGRRCLATHVEQPVAAQPSDNKKERVVILGSGWGGYTLSRRLSQKTYAPLIISPRSYFVFTPLLTNTASGSLDFSNIVEPVRDPRAKVDFIQAAARGVNLKKKTVLCEATVVKSGVTESPRTAENERGTEDGPQTTNMKPMQAQRQWEQGETFEVPYDKLVIAVGAVSQTFGTPGVRENAMFFKDIGDAKRVKRRVRECFELAALPFTTPEMRKWLLNFAIVGAGPTGIELAASLRDFIYSDLMALYPTLDALPKITLYDVAPKVLSMFDESLSRYAMETMEREGIDIKTSHHVKSLRWGQPGAAPPYHMDPKRCLTLTTEEDGELGVGMCVWATGNAMPKFITDSLDSVDAYPRDSIHSVESSSPVAIDVEHASWKFKKAPKQGPLLVDGHLRVQLQNETGQTAVLRDVFALGDNAMPETGAPPATAQATSQESKWLADRLNKNDLAQTPPFSFRDLGTMAYIGDERALMQIPHKAGRGSNSFMPEGIKGRTASLIWKTAYIGMSISWRNKLRVAFRWTLNKFFGRDVSRF